MSTLFRSEAKVLQTLSCFKYYNVLKQEDRFTLGLDCAKHTDYIEKRFEQKLF